MFKLQHNVNLEMKRLEKLKRNEPDVALILHKNGQILIELAGKGPLSTLRTICETNPEPWDIMSFTIIKMFKKAIINGKYDIIQFMIQNGFNINHTSCQTILHDIIESTTDTYDNKQSMIQFLIQNGIDLNYQRPFDYYSPLHLCCKYLNDSIAYLLIIYGADVNAVAKDDMLPRTLVENQKNVEPNDIIKKKNLLELLIKENAKLTWRKTINDMNFNQKSLNGSKIVTFLS